MIQDPPQEQNQYFTAEELALLTDIEPGSQIVQVTYYQWINRTKAAAEFAFIDKIELQFAEGKTLLLAINEADTGMTVLSDYDFKAEKRRITEEFDGKITLTKRNAGQETVWTEVLSQPLFGIVLDKQEGVYLNWAILLHYETEKRIVFMTAENGLTVDFYED